MTLLSQFFYNQHIANHQDRNHFYRNHFSIQELNEFKSLSDKLFYL